MKKLMFLFCAGLAAATIGGCGDDDPATAEVCTNGTDDDGDGQTDCADSDCAAAPSCTGDPEVCDNTLDDDGDGATDCADSDCAADPACVASDCGNGAIDTGEDCDGTELG